MVVVVMFVFVAALRLSVDNGYTWRVLLTEPSAEALKFGRVVLNAHKIVDSERASTQVRFAVHPPISARAVVRQSGP